MSRDQGITLTAPMRSGLETQLRFLEAFRARNSKVRAYTIAALLEVALRDTEETALAMAELADRIGLSPGMMSEIVHKDLCIVYDERGEQIGLDPLVSTSPDAQQHRIRRVRLTSAGRKFIRTVLNRL